MAYIGQPQLFPINSISPLAKVIPLSFSWLTYQAAFVGNPPNVGARVSMDGLGPQQTIDKIVSVYIDNLGVDVPVYVYFPDTQHTVVALPDSAGWYLVFTNQRTMFVIAEGLTPGDDVTTRVLVTNIFMPPNTDQEISQTLALYKASPTISRGTTIYNQNYGVPALGDQFKTTTIINMLTPAAVIAMLPAVAAGGFYYINAISFKLFGPGAAVAGIGDSVFESPGVSGVLFDLPYSWPNNVQANVVDILTLMGMNIKISALESWRYRTVVPISGSQAQGSGILNIVYTYNPS